MAMQDAREQTLERVLDLLLYRESKYNNALNKKGDKVNQEGIHNIFDELGNPKIKKIKENKQKKDLHKKRLIQGKQRRERGRRA